MRKQNSEFLTAFASEASKDIKNTDYFGFVELDDYACYVIADGIDDQLEAFGARLAVTAATSAFLEAPGMSRHTVRNCLKAANRALLDAKSKMKLKASIIIVLTDYVRMRYGQAGNIRLRLYRNGFVKYASSDQSLTMELVKEEKLSQDKVAAHVERNNLYAYLGQERGFHPYVSSRLKLTNADAIALYTRDVWEHIDEGELKDIFGEASDKPQETVDSIEDMLLSRQAKDLKKYTLAVIFVNKLFTDPKRKKKIRAVLMAGAAAATLGITIAVMLAIQQHRKEEKRAQMLLGYTDTIEYIQINNYAKAQESCEKAGKLAEELKDEKMQKELGSYRKLIDAVTGAQELLEKGKYAEAQDGFREAAKRAGYADNLGMDYINGKLELTADYISVYDLIFLGDSLVLNQQYDKAEEKYLEARAQSSQIYFDEGRSAAVEALEKLYEEQQKQLQEEQEERKEQLVQEEAGASFVAQGDAAFAQGDYESAKVYYSSALQKFEQLSDEIQGEVVSGKLETAGRKLEEKKERLEEAEEYMLQAAEMTEAGDYISAKKYYLLARDVYASAKEEDKVDEIARKMEMLSIKEQGQSAQQEEAP